MELRLYNTMGRRVEPFVPLKAGEVGLYCCGPTVYNYAHIGNLRTYVFEDVLRRTLEHAGYRVTHVMNVTDVGHLTDDADDGEDKMEKGARREGRTVWEVAEFYTRAFFRDFSLLGCRMPGVVCRATDHVVDMIDLIRRIEARGFTYEAGGNLCFDISKFAGYGRLALLVLNSWGIKVTRDFGEIVYALIDHEWMSAQSTDNIDDFNSVYDFQTVFRDHFTF